MVFPYSHLRGRTEGVCEEEIKEVGKRKRSETKAGRRGGGKKHEHILSVQASMQLNGVKSGKMDDVVRTDTFHLMAVSLLVYLW